ncbi:MAG: ankyrin repeat domain-containing protein [Cellvibrionaceae bacterium]
MCSNRFLLSLLIIFGLSASVAFGQNLTFFFDIEKGSISKVSAKIKTNNTNLEQRNHLGDTAVIVAARNGQLEILRLLVENGANINALDSKKRDVLNIAISTRNPALAQLALQLGADPTMVTSVYDGGAIIYGSAKGAVEIVEMLIKAGAPVNRINNLGWTALLEVAILGNNSKEYIAIAQMLIAAGADRSIKDNEGKTAFDHAKDRGNHELAKILAF